jgi:hypothetical protein
LCNGNGQSAAGCRQVLADDDSATPSGSLTPVNDADAATPSINETPLSLRRDPKPKPDEQSPDEIGARVPESNLAENKCANPRFQDQVPHVFFGCFSEAFF